ncbi:hypothetical protein CKAH01_11340 [Colletotrichum kahawae]|uniref:Uncharacterized protein n=1 Tax=Colletotrichum kahawae TaxID=34407 RepID=A0AAD9YUP6_COLKA|nr:hypothetical protein CKAH01_11340 [Colletotrichum kahawae]
MGSFGGSRKGGQLASQQASRRQFRLDTEWNECCTKGRENLRMVVYGARGLKSLR